LLGFLFVDDVELSRDALKTKAKFSYADIGRGLQASAVHWRRCLHGARADREGVEIYSR